MHEAVTSGILVVAILFGILCNHYEFRRLRYELRSEIGSFRSEVNASCDRIESRLDAAGGKGGKGELGGITM
jgi:hypothetical protein